LGEVLWQAVISAQQRRQPSSANFDRRLASDVPSVGIRISSTTISFRSLREQHFRPQDMVALCGNCHPSVANLGRDLQYAIKSNPHNVRNGQLRGALEYDKRDLVFKVGGNWYENVSVILQFSDLPIIACRIAEGQAQVSLNLLDRNGYVVLKVVENNIAFRVDDLWDFEYGYNVAVARYGSNDIALRLDFRKPEAVIEGKIWFRDRQVKLGPNETTLPGQNIFRGGKFVNAAVGIRLN
jgi:hypothetical protein